MKNGLKLLYACCLSGMLGLFSACENSGAEEVFDSREEQNGLLEEWKYEVIPGQYVVTLHEGTLGTLPSAKGAGSYKASMETGKLQLLSLFSKSDLSDAQVKAVYGYTIEGFTAALSDEQLQILRADARVKSIEPDYLIILAPPPGRGPGGGGSDGEGGTSAQETPWGITRVNGGSNYTGNGVAWILDSGIDLDHEDLNVDTSRGTTFITRGKDSDSPDDGNGHGTHVAGTIAAIDNNTGVVGVAAGATVVPVKVLDSRGSGSYSGVIAGVDYVGANGSNGDVANMSLGGPLSQALNRAVEAAAIKGIKFVLAAGNESQDANNVSPASANGSNVYTISAMREGDTWASFSNYGNPPVDYCAPGVSITSTWKNGGYNTISGTSMAAPHAAGILLLGSVKTGGFVVGDPDGNADPIAVH